MTKKEHNRPLDSVESIRMANRMRDYPHDDVSVYLKEYRNPYMITPHLHTEYEIYYNISGGKGFFIDDHYYDCNPHDLFIIRKMHIHRVAVGEPDNYVRCVISIDSIFIDKLRLLLSDRTALDFLDAAGDTLPVKVHLEKEDHEKYLMHIKEYLRFHICLCIIRIITAGNLHTLLLYLQYVTVVYSDAHVGCNIDGIAQPV